MTENKPKKPGADENEKVQKPSWPETLILLKKGANQLDEKTELKPDHYEVIVAEIDRLNNENKELKENNLNHIARLQTMARRHGNEHQQAIKYGSQELARSILKPLDLFKKIIDAPVKNDEIKNYLMGFEMIAKQLDHALTENGIKQISVKIGDDFNPQYHEATELIETKEVPKGKIAAIHANGYQLHDRVLTHALVKVAK